MINNFPVNILLTGASGFIGQRFIENNKNHLVNTVSLRDNAIADLDLKDIDIIVHLAGKAHDLKKVSSPDAYYKVNYELTKELFDKFLHSNAKKFIFVSSVKATADQVEGILTEEHPSNPQTPYGKSKLMAEAYILSHLPSNKSVTLSPSNCDEDESG